MNALEIIALVIGLALFGFLTIGAVYSLIAGSHYHPWKRALGLLLSLLGVVIPSFLLGCDLTANFVVFGSLCDILLQALRLVCGTLYVFKCIALNLCFIED